MDVVKFKTVNKDTDKLKEGENRVTQQGKDGYTTVTYLITYTDGVEIKREETDRKVVKPVDKVVEVGTGIITTKTEDKKEKVVKFTSKNENTDTLPKGETKVKTKGVDGFDTVTYTITLKDGKETSRKETKRTTTPITQEVILVGTKEEPKPEPNPDPDEPETEE